MPGEKSVQEFATNEAIQCTEIYEFVQKLGSPEFEMPTLQVRIIYILLILIFKPKKLSIVIFLRIY